MSRLLVVCHANVARSVVAACILRTSTPPGSIEVRSRGTHVVDGQPMSAWTKAALETMLGPALVGAHRARAIAADDVDWSDLVVTAEASQVRLLRLRFPASAPKTGSLRSVARTLPEGPSAFGTRVASMHLEGEEPADSDDVADPAGGDLAAYVSMVEALMPLCAELGRRIVG